MKNLQNVYRLRLCAKQKVKFRICIICNPDFGHAAGYFPKLKLTMTKTLMQGEVYMERTSLLQIVARIKRLNYSIVFCSRLLSFHNNKDPQVRRHKFYGLFLKYLLLRIRTFQLVHSFVR